MTAGSNRCERACGRLWNAPKKSPCSSGASSGTCPDSGSQLSVRPKIKMKMMPSQKLGIDWPIIANVMTAPSTAVPRLSAANTPRGIANRVAKRNAATVSSIVAGKCSMTTPNALDL